MNDEYLGHGNNRAKYSARYIGVPTAGMNPYHSATPNIIIKYNPSMLFNHDFYFPGSAYMSSEPQRYSEYGGFTSLDGPDSAFRMPRTARPMSCTWVSASDVEPYFGRRNMDIVDMKLRMPEGGWEYITYPRLTAQTNDIGRADMTTWGSGTCEIYRFYQPQLTDMTLIGNNSNYTAIRNFYCPNLTSMKSSFNTINWSSAPLPHISHAIAEIENFYAPNLVVQSAAFTMGTDARYRALTSIKNANVGSGLHRVFEIMDHWEAPDGYRLNRYIENYTSHSLDGLHGDFHWYSNQELRFKVNGDFVIDVDSLTGGARVPDYFKACDFGTKSATNVYIGPKDKAIYENSSISSDVCYTGQGEMVTGFQCHFGPYPVKFYTCVAP